MVICPDASSAQNNMAAVSADGSTVCVLVRRLNSLCSRSVALVVWADFHSLWFVEQARDYATNLFPPYPRRHLSFSVPPGVAR